LKNTIQELENQSDKSQSEVDNLTKLSHKYNKLLKLLSKQFPNEHINYSFLQQQLKEQENSIQHYQTKHHKSRYKRKELIQEKDEFQQENEQLKLEIENIQQTKNEEIKNLKNEKLFELNEEEVQNRGKKN
jgi:hypothetical protein